MTSPNLLGLKKKALPNICGPEADVQAISQQPKSGVVTQLVWVPVADAGMEGAILDAVSDETSRRILNSTLAKGKSVEEMANEIDVPLSTVYRHVHKLKEAGLMSERIGVTRAGSKHALYRSILSGMTLALGPGGLHVGMTPNEGIQTDFTEFGSR
jgi:DNA-binding transcriptional ArsR family regulator